jgi:hypothetical protein
MRWQVGDELQLSQNNGAELFHMAQLQLGGWCESG